SVRCRFQDLGNRWGCLRPGYTLDRLVQPIKESSLNLISQPTTIRSTLSSLLNDEHCVCFLDGRTDGLPINGSSVQPTQVNDFGIDQIVFLCNLPGNMHHVQIAKHCHISTFTNSVGNTHG